MANPRFNIGTAFSRPYVPGQMTHWEVIVIYILSQVVCPLYSHSNTHTFSYTQAEGDIPKN
jgi:hypothetical protein